MPEMPATDHECVFPVQPFREDGTREDREHCRVCGKPWPEAQADLAGSLLARVEASAAGVIASRDAEIAKLRAVLADYGNRISWDTNCGEHARLLDSCYAAEVRAEQAEAKLAALQADLAAALGYASFSGAPLAPVQRLMDAARRCPDPCEQEH